MQRFSAAQIPTSSRPNSPAASDPNGIEFPSSKDTCAQRPGSSTRKVDTSYSCATTNSAGRLQAVTSSRMNRHGRADCESSKKRPVSRSSTSSPGSPIRPSSTSPIGSANDPTDTGTWLGSSPPIWTARSPRSRELDGGRWPRFRAVRPTCTRRCHGSWISFFETASERTPVNERRSDSWRLGASTPSLTR